MQLRCIGGSREENEVRLRLSKDANFNENNVINCTVIRIGVERVNRHLVGINLSGTKAAQEGYKPKCVEYN